jgi:F0F1-type ATP synthase assembly protein I
LIVFLLLGFGGGTLNAMRAAGLVAKGDAAGKKD